VITILHKAVGCELKQWAFREKEINLKHWNKKPKEHVKP